MLPGAQLAGRALPGDGEDLGMFALHSLAAPHAGRLLIT